jgi:hypothetical protein
MKTRRDGKPTRNAKKVEELRRAGRLWCAHIKGTSYADIALAEGLDVSPQEMARLVENAGELVGALNVQDWKVERTRIVEGERYDALQAGVWDMAIGTMVSTLIDEISGEGLDQERFEELAATLEPIMTNQLKAVDSVLKIMAARAKLFGLNREPDQAVNLTLQMPTIVFTIPSVGESNLETLGITIDVDPIEIR